LKVKSSRNSLSLKTQIFGVELPHLEIVEANPGIEPICWRELWTAL